MFAASSIPWKPAAITMLPSSSARRIRSVEIDWMRALVCVLSVHDADLGPGEADRLVAQRMDGHGHQRHAHLLAGREEHVHFAAPAADR